MIVIMIVIMIVVVIVMIHVQWFLSVGSQCQVQVNRCVIGHMIVIIVIVIMIAIIVIVDIVVEFNDLNLLLNSLLL